MMGTESISKEERTDLQQGRDRLSELPLGIIHTILAFVPITEAIRTSILSRRWRYTWTSLPHLVFEDNCTFGEYYKFAQDSDDCLDSFITHVLFLHKGPVHKFELSVPFEWYRPNMGAWLLCLSRKDLRELTIDTARSQCMEVQRLHSCIYSCKKLTKLELFDCELDPPPTTFKAFLFLRYLSLRNVPLSTDEVERLVANCPLLEELKVLNCSLTAELRITAPNLKVLFLLDGYVNLSVNAPLLAELSVDLNGNGFDEVECSSCNYTDFIDGFTNLEKLYGDGFFSRYLSMGIESCHHTLVFHRLKDISLTGVDFEDIKDISVVARLILGAPNLEKLTLSHISHTLEDHDASKVQHVSFSDLGCTPDFKLEKLSFVKMTCITGLPHQMTLIRFLLECSPVLETMCLGAPSSTEKEKVSAELDESKRASPNVKLTVLDDSPEELHG